MQWRCSYQAPAVITQPISCDLGIPADQEHFAALSLYISLAVLSILTIPISYKIGRRTLILVALYVAVFVTMICSLVSNLLFLVLSRVVLGCSLALNLATTAVYMAEISSTKQFFMFSMTAITTAFSLKVVVGVGFWDTCLSI